MSNLEEAKEISTRLLLIKFEGTGPMTADGKFKAYVDPATGAEPITIAWGLTYHSDGTPIELGEVWDYEYAFNTKHKVLNKFLNDLISYSPSLLKAKPTQIAAVLSWVYNLGLGNYRASTFKKKVDNQDWIAAANECKKWNKANGRVMKGLTRRRAAEAVLLLV